MPNTRTSSIERSPRPSRNSLNALAKVNAERKKKAESRTKPAKSYRNTGKDWVAEDVKMLGELASENTPTRVIGLKLGRTESAIRDKASAEAISLKPANRSPYNRTTKAKKKSTAKKR